MLQDPRAGHHPEESQNRRPRNAHPTKAGKLRVQPILGGPVLWEGARRSIYQEVCVNQDQRNFSSSTSLITSHTLSILSISSRPQSNDLVRNGFLFLGSAVMSRRPRRSASFTRSFRLSSRSRRSRSSSAATSSSMVRVVLIHQDISYLMS